MLTISNSFTEHCIAKYANFLLLSSHKLTPNSLLNGVISWIVVWINSNILNSSEKAYFTLF